jgi:hypothetical protein
MAKYLAIAFSCLLFLTVQAESQTVPFNSERWEIQAAESKVIDHLSLRDHHVTLPPRATPLSRRLYREMMKRRFAALEEVVGGVEKY